MKMRIYVDKDKGPDYKAMTKNCDKLIKQVTKNASEYLRKSKKCFATVEETLRLASIFDAALAEVNRVHTLIAQTISSCHNPGLAGTSPPLPDRDLLVYKQDLEKLLNESDLYSSILKTEKADMLKYPRFTDAKSPSFDFNSEGIPLETRQAIDSVFEETYGRAAEARAFLNSLEQAENSTDMVRLTDSHQCQKFEKQLTILLDNHNRRLKAVILRCSESTGIDTSSLEKYAAKKENIFYYPTLEDLTKELTGYKRCHALFERDELVRIYDLYKHYYIKSTTYKSKTKFNTEKLCAIRHLLNAKDSKTLLELIQEIKKNPMIYEGMIIHKMKNLLNDLEKRLLKQPAADLKHTPADVEDADAKQDSRDSKDSKHALKDSKKTTEKTDSPTESKEHKHEPKKSKTCLASLSAVTNGRRVAHEPSGDRPAQSDLALAKGQQAQILSS